MQNLLLLQQALKLKTNNNHQKMIRSPKKKVFHSI